MLIDWVSANLPTDSLDLELVRAWMSRQDRILRISGDGQMIWESTAWDSVRSDSHQIAFQVNANHIRIQGSPSRVIGDGDNVFSSGASAALDLAACVLRMINFVNHQVGVDLPIDLALWKVTRVDVTQNLDLGGLAYVRQALAILRNCEGGRYRVSQQAGDTVYWSHKSRLRSGKAYAKGAELAHQMQKRKPDDVHRAYTTEEIAIANNLLRLELKLGAQWWRRLETAWYLLEPADLESEWGNYFNRMIGGAEIMSEANIYEKLLQVVEIDANGKPKEGRAKAAFQLWCILKSEGWQKARDMSTKTTWYRNLRYLHAAGLSDADISAGNVVQLRRKIIEARFVNSWADLRQAA